MTELKKENIFVFVVCGEKKHIETLHFSLSFLTKFSENKIIVVTDSKRNEIKIIHKNIIDVNTPEKYDHHQASIWLKTSLHKILPPGSLYCYLDSDVIALNKECDLVFNEFLAPITFASDHCHLNQFSPYAVRCSCLQNTKEQKEKLGNLIKKHNPYSEQENVMNNMTSREFYRLISYIKKHPFSYIHKILQFIIITYILPGKNRIFHLNKLIHYDKSKKLWIDSEQKPLLYHVLNYYKKIEKESQFKFKLFKTTWFDENGKNVYMPECEHLPELIKKKFNLVINEKNWQHWNGGVFLFNEESNNFMETWHNFTSEIFNDPNWVTRDQGTLIATTWKFGLQHHKRIPMKFNFIADYYNPLYTYSKHKGFTPNNFETSIVPSLIHIYHEFGHRGWEIWDKVEEIKTINNIQ